MANTERPFEEFPVLSDESVKNVDISAALKHILDIAKKSPALAIKGALQTILDTLHNAENQEGFVTEERQSLVNEIAYAITEREDIAEDDLVLIDPTLKELRDQFRVPTI